MAVAPPQKPAGDISDAFASMLGGESVALEPRFATLKKGLIAGREANVSASWRRLLEHLRQEVAQIKELGTEAVPEISIEDIKNGNISTNFKAAYLSRGVCVVRNVMPEQDALDLKASLRSYVASNSETKAFPKTLPQVYELYWSEAQLRARSHPNLLDVSKFLMSFWKVTEETPVSLRHPVSYADRLRMRTPGDVKFALGPHIDAGSLERWEESGYGRGDYGKGVYAPIFEGKWEEYDPWNAGVRLGAVTDLYNGVGACSMFRMSQGWLGMSNIRAGEGHLMVNPMLRAATAYTLLRPFFEARQPRDAVTPDEYLSPDNWQLEPETTVRMFETTVPQLTTNTPTRPTSPAPRPAAAKN